jgi:hypothetical protein
MIAGIDGGLEDFGTLVGYLHPLEPADQFFGFSAEHAPANHLDGTPSLTGYVRLDKHI